jgi:ADP-heptose:LPS heptosyltransferase
MEPMTIDKTKIKKILIMNSGGIGDLILSLPALYSIKKHFPDSVIIYFTGSWQKELASAGNIFDEIIKWDKEDSRYFLSPGSTKYSSLRMLTYIPSLRSYDFDLVINFHGDLRSRIMAMVIRAPFCLGFDSSDRERKAVNASHASMQFVKVLEPLEIPKSHEKHFFDIPVDSMKTTQEFLRKNGISESDKILVIHPVARWNAKEWSKDNFAVLSDRLMGIAGIKVVFVGAGEDLPRIAKIKERMTNIPVIAAGELDLLEIAALLQKSALFVGHDAAPMHIAGALNVPTIALFGATNPVIFGPLGSKAVVIRKINETCPACSGQSCVYPEIFCMDQISPDEVFDLCVEYL